GPHTYMRTSPSTSGTSCSLERVRVLKRVMGGGATLQFHLSIVEGPGMPAGQTPFGSALTGSRQPPAPGPKAASRMVAQLRGFHPSCHHRSRVRASRLEWPAGRHVLLPLEPLRLPPPPGGRP